MMRNFLVAMLMAGFTVVAAAETVYKWSDARGQIHYTDLPPTQADAKILSISHQQAEFVDDGSQGDESDNGDNSDNSGGPTTLPSGNNDNDPTIDREAMAAVQADVANAKSKQCKDAQDRYKRYVESRRLFRETDGKREYLTDKQLADARVSAKQAVDDYCN